MKKIFTATLLISSVLLLTNCGKEHIKQSSLAETTNTDGSLGGITPTPQPGVDPVSQLDFKGRIESGDTNNNALAFDFDKSRGEFIIMIPMPSGFLFTPSGSFNNRPDITFSPIIDSDGRMKFAVRVPVKYILKGATFLPPASLPNGDPLPKMPAGYGELPSLGLTFPQHDNTQITLYIGINAVGLFVTLPDKAALPFGFTLPVKNSDKSKTFGYLSYVPKKGTYAPGLFVSTLIPASMARILEDYFHL
ncbi:MAG: hypothetical protein A2622_02455 [Bdellovibrionales bacterium RIFCSPHIGHO2_01_FULL_40_29]|nr:MAG: hypothetical protein A2622_02455 [Bdellovibrionales bacterium RIFCSPHIGHO2_01_FULL_40_29]OFZ33944.1 MAG: hypothetical protein A3D17_02875 [Bdellovibrionales bacterium RIFCSPHIGHO2_02_FULL_40_15]